MVRILVDLNMSDAFSIVPTLLCFANGPVSPGDKVILQDDALEYLGTVVRIDDQIIYSRIDELI